MEISAEDFIQELQSAITALVIEGIKKDIVIRKLGLLAPSEAKTFPTEGQDC